MVGEESEFLEEAEGGYNAFVSMDFDDPKKFLQFINPIGSSVIARSNGWWFRGQTDSSWPLSPSAHRADTDFPAIATECLVCNRPTHLMSRLSRHLYVANAKLHPLSDELLTAEAMLVERFRNAANQQSYPIPWDLPSPNTNQNPDLQRQERLAAMSGKKVSVYVLNASEVFSVKEQKSHFEIQPVFASHSTNRNLAAQRGRFSLVSSTHAGHPFVPAIDTFFRDEVKVYGEKRGLPLLWQLNISWKHAGAILYLLDRLDINGATMFPQLDGASRLVREQSTYVVPGS